ncbi:MULTISPECIES: DUF4236 domain-containing protein [Streptomyces]|uniref:DUF4236 domain-containing protein n=1 Tax=Streptomyces cinereoruber TaxID=67260 RepID=A0AAV4KGG5_9ACTN|nr:MULTISPECIES: DUF4236 domain-containing protein [Streptomyces]AVH98785.1 DUF4236 domain-containing protein [Streptomyces sp. WAC00288]KYG52315.1 hypothetical protein AWI43_23975 [Streptomyces sp. WAC04657]MBB4160551.1 hypothetical protein [Streptomyces cinereoruber]MBY8820479.1 DUF4236 domain-containing protein [Streptomyces cinereoruber]NIH62930.1 hypothetical protein [Streptomyces cinereoruber]
MSIHYRKQITLVPKLLRLNIGTHGWSLSLGPRRAHVAFHSRGGRSASVRLPGGLTWHRHSRRR